MNPKVIVIDGKTYNSTDEMPADIRQKYEEAIRALGDANSNQIPDAFETMNLVAEKDKDGVPDGLEDLTARHTVLSSMKIIVDGKEFDGLEDLPPEARAKFEEAMGKLDANRNGIPDFAEETVGGVNQNGLSVSGAAAGTQRRAPTPLVGPTSTPDTSNGLMLALAGLLLFLLCVAGGGAIWYFFLR